MGPYNETPKKNRFLIVLMDVCSKWVEAVPVPKVRPKILIDFLERTFQQWGYPETIMSDNDKSFTSDALARYFAQHRITQYLTPIYHQRSNPVERRNQELKKLLRVHCLQRGEDRWDTCLGQILFTLRNRENAATGVSPSVALLGAPLVKPGEWNIPEVRQPILNTPQQRENRLEQIRRRQIVFNRNLIPEHVEPKVIFNIGDRVFIRSFAGVKTPLGPTWSGPYRVVRVCGLNVYEVKRNDSSVLVHVDDLRPWVTEPQWSDPEHDPMCEPEEAVLDDPEVPVPEPVPEEESDDGETSDLDENDDVPLQPSSMEETRSRSDNENVPVSNVHPDEM
ncbi:uncharacterized protein K02A2.6-like [Anoplophora glabripennis]|uniref:uncharacterized protein K02A2.6-like n=1 Tax=Anoplophora glabripennis TaxID=217634 RepID=UPI00087446DE|nr:uncharacterized protein K02A2.6-like [Anoplophora glabripennis]